MGSQEQVKACELEVHEKEICVRPCRWDCRESIGPLWVGGNTKIRALWALLLVTVMCILMSTGSEVPRE